MAETTTATPDAEASAIDALIETTEVDLVTLLMPRRSSYEEGFEDDRTSLDFGPAGRHDAEHDQENIKFFPREPEGPGIAVVPRNHARLVDGSLLRRYPDIQILEPETKRSFVCEVCGKEFRQPKSLLTHKQSHQT